MNRSLWCRGAAATLVLAALAISGCGDGAGNGSSGGPLSADAWRQRVNGFCGDGYQEATALPLPQSAARVGPDATARAEILASVRDSVLTLGQPDGIDPDAVSGYVDELNADIDQLGAIADAAEAGDPNAGHTQLDESAGQAAVDLGLDDCAALAQAIARTP